MLVILWVCAAVVGYTFFIYPLILWIRPPITYFSSKEYKPKVTIIITAYNEEKCILNKLENTASLNYPRQLLEVILVSDGSTDQTTALARAFDRFHVTVMDLPRQGKTMAQNEALNQASGEIIVFSDANALYDSSAINYLVEPFADETVGCVCGRLRYQHQRQESTYWTYENLLKKLEGKWGFQLGVNGGIYALRKSLFSPLAPDAISDLTEPMKIIEQGYKVLYISDAVAWEEEPMSAFWRKYRIILRSLHSMKYFWPVINPMKDLKISWAFFSHKILRWFLPVILIIFFLTNLIVFLMYGQYPMLLLAQTLFYISAIVSPSIRYFIQVNSASFLALLDWVRGKRIISWNSRKS